MTSLFNSIASGVFRTQRTRLGMFGPLVVLIVVLGMLSQATAADFVDTRVYVFDGQSSPITLMNKYVRVRGTLLPAQAHTVNAGGGEGKFSLIGSRYVPVIIEGATDPLYVYDGNLPAVPETGGPVELVGLISNKQSFPPIFLDVGNPPNIPLKNTVALIGIGLGLLLIGWLLLGAALRAFDFAPPALRAGNRLGIGAFWYGGLGSAFANGAVREAPVRVGQARGEVHFEAADADAGWTVRVREPGQIKSLAVCTSFGALPALRLRFVDERGQQRAGVIAFGDAAERADVLERLRQLRSAKPETRVAGMGA
jgi:hypothetical protein